MDQGFQTSMVVQRPVMETNRARNPTAVLSGPPDEPTQVVTPDPRPHQSHNVLDGEKTGAVLLLLGVLLALVGVTFTTTGWHHYQANPNFEWTQLLGPILISVGGTFMLTSVCKFGIISCRLCRQGDEEALVTPVMEQTSAGSSFTLSGINQPIVLHNAATMLCIPPQCNFITQEVCQAIEFQPGRSVNGILGACPLHDAPCYMDNAAFTAEEEDGSAHCTETDCRQSRTEKTEDERGCSDESGAACSPPPAYEDIYPSFNKHDLT